MIFATSILLKIKIKFMQKANVSVKGETKAGPLRKLSQVYCPFYFSHFKNTYADDLGTFLRLLH